MPSKNPSLRLPPDLYAELQLEAAAEFLTVSKYSELILRKRPSKKP